MKYEPDEGGKAGKNRLPQTWTTNKKFVNFANLPSLILGGGK